jgi:hypothetical protein
VGIEKLSASIEKTGGKCRALLSRIWIALSRLCPESGDRLPASKLNLKAKKFAPRLLRRIKHLKIGFSKTSWHKQCFLFGSSSR